MNLGIKRRRAVPNSSTSVQSLKMRTLAAAFCCSLVPASQAQADDRLVDVGDFFHEFSQYGAIGYLFWQHGSESALGCLAGSLANNAATAYIKDAIDAPRPNGGGRGMPSGHTSRVASSFGCLLAEEGWSLPTIAMGAATAITGYSRVEGNYHTPEQVLAGAVLGTTLGYLGTEYLFATASEIGVTLPIGETVETGVEVSRDARSSLIDFANNR